MINLLFCIKIVVWCVTTDASTTSSLAAPTEGGRIATALQQTQRIANNPQSTNQTFAEALLALYKNADYVRHGDPINLKYAIDPALNGNRFSIVPNPAQDVVTLILPNYNQEQLYVNIYDISGRLVQTNVIKNTATTISTQHLLAGIYICKLSNSDSQTQKLVIIK